MSKLEEAGGDELWFCMDKIPGELQPRKKSSVRGLCGGRLWKRLEAEYHDKFLVSAVL